MIYYLNDFLVRRTGKIFFDRQNAEKQIDYLANFLALQLHIEDSSNQKALAAVKEEFLSAVSFY
jgi:hypothetical protein